MTEDQAEQLADTREPPAIYRRQEKEFRATRPAKDLPCLFPGCSKKWRPSSEYKDVVAHWERMHAKDQAV
jgi:hypothetical protein